MTTMLPDKFSSPFSLLLLFFFCGGGGLPQRVKWRVAATRGGRGQKKGKEGGA